MQNKHQKKWYTLGISIDRQFVLVPFSSNVAWDILSRIAWVHLGPHCICSLSVNPRSQVLIYRPARGGEQDTQQENSNTKQAITYIHHATVCFECEGGFGIFLALPFLLKIKATLYSIKKRRAGSVLYSQPRNLLFTKWISTYMGKVAGALIWPKNVI